MPRYDFQIPASFKHRVVFTRDAFAADNRELAAVLAEGGGRRVLAVIEETVAAAWPGLRETIAAYLAACGYPDSGIHILPGGEAAKADDTLVSRAYHLIHAERIDRHSYLIAIGGGAFLDAAGYAAATAHRGVRLVRFPTTTLSQDDSGVGVKCGINAFGKKNWIGAFAVPFAVINDFRFLASQEPASARAGLVEAVKVALVKDAEFFHWIEANAASLARLETGPLEECVRRSALLHAEHIAAGGDPFEMGSSRPLDFGHWAAHKLEAMSGYTLPHAQAVAVGLALDSHYSARIGICPEETAARVIAVLQTLGLKTWHEGLAERDSTGHLSVLAGLDEFREHLGGPLTVLMLTGIGKTTDVHEIDGVLVGECVAILRKISESPA